MTPEFLTDDEIVKVTEYALPAKQREELVRLGITFIPSRTGKPIVLRDTVRKVLGHKSPSSNGEYVPPNLDD